MQRSLSVQPSAKPHVGRITGVSLILLPLVCVIWLTTKSMRHEQVIARQRLIEVYTNQLASAQNRLDGLWEAKVERAKAIAREHPTEIVNRVVEERVAHAIHRDDSIGRIGSANQYDTLARNDKEFTAMMRRARILEFREGELLEAAKAYGTAAEATVNADSKAQALLARGNCFEKAGDRGKAIEDWRKLAEGTGFGSARDVGGDLIAPNSMARWLHVLKPPDPHYHEVATMLVTRLNRYGEPPMKTLQRLFLMESYLSLKSTPSRDEPALVADCDATAEAGIFPTHSALSLEVTYAEAQLAGNSPGNIWVVELPDSDLTLLFRKECLDRELLQTLETMQAPDRRIVLLSPDDPVNRGDPIGEWSAGAHMPGWRLAMTFPGDDPFKQENRRQSIFHLWMGVFAVLAVVVPALLIARAARAQIRFAQAKDELLSIVSHELKTPLTGVRGLIDTLSSGRIKDQEKRQTYLHQAALQCQRLSRLIDNFLTYSKMERGQYQCHLVETRPCDILDACQAMFETGARAGTDSIRFGVSPNLPSCYVDPEAIVSVLINLIENALKFTGDDKEISVRVTGEEGWTQFEVRDNGIGMSDDETRRACSRFYQVDRSMSRRNGGCGLGLSLALGVVNSHAGSLEIESQPNYGTLVRVRVPNRSPNQKASISAS